MFRRLLVGSVLLLSLIMLAGLVSGPVEAQEDNAICPDQTMNWLVATSGALPSGASVNCRATPPDLVWAVPQEPPAGFEYAYSWEEAYGYYDVFLYGGELSGPIEFCMLGVEGIEGETLAVWSGVPNAWHILPTWPSGDSFCAQTEVVGGVALVYIPGGSTAPASTTTTTTSSDDSTTTTTSDAAADDDAPLPVSTVDLSVVFPGDQETCIVRAKYTVRLRVDPNTTSGIIDRVPWQSTMLSDLRTTDDLWMRVNYVGDLGWIHTRFLEESEACARLNQIAPMP